MSKNKRLGVLFFSTFSLTLLGGCGQSGALYLPEQSEVNQSTEAEQAEAQAPQSTAEETQQ